MVSCGHHTHYNRTGEVAKRDPDVKHLVVFICVLPICIQQSNRFLGIFSVQGPGVRLSGTFPEALTRSRFCM